MLRVFRYIVNLWWKLVFAWKKRTGWLDLGEQIEVTGVVLNFIPPDVDGDRTFNLKLDPGQEKYITGFGGRLTMESGTEPSLHCEIPPWSPQALRDLYDELAKLPSPPRVRVRGAWGFDGVHLGKSYWIEIPAALVRHMPNVRDGWFEIHPVSSLEVVA